MNTCLWRFLLLGWALSLMSFAHAADAKRVVRLTNGEWPPYVSQDLKYDGVVSLIVKEAFASEGYEVKFTFLPWKRALQSAQDGEWDGSILWAYREERTQYFIYSDPISSTQYVFFHLRNAEFDWKDFSDLKKYRFGLTLGYNYNDKFMDMVRNEEIAHDYASDIVSSFKMMFKHRVDVVPEDVEVGYFILSSEFAPGVDRMVTSHLKPLSEEKHYLLISRRVPDANELIEAFNRGLKKMRASGRLESLFEKSRMGDFIQKK
ncbi:transporter substrate-binding domain-containing protein [Hahella sp. KA22]|uniref:substrate-binding periplasmic protein n=1 Tax=Hahella sp. KA22 TaxID=1628392 RepID=UPI000FDF5572|nr:transporter substrate-binding domain-containing protein [Hahella sp. KA22]AZZ90176.1 transporter substrate-binding domain-containing protein [Hahella sp. KA22]QAY53546.1 transporter substrate-binding domain-containing protein [Hahella sp. KA22]